MKKTTSLLSIILVLFFANVSCITEESDEGDGKNGTVKTDETSDGAGEKEHPDDESETGENKNNENGDDFCGPGLTRAEWESEEWKNGDDDGDGIPNWYECPECPCRDSDGDGIPDYLDLDSDGDGIPDYEECPPLNYDTCTPLQWDGMECINDTAHGIPADYPYCVPPFDPEVGCRDTSGDGIPDYLHLDSDLDGISDADERNGKYGYVTCPYKADTDGDGTDDLAEVVFGTDPTDPESGPPAGTFYVVLPYNANSSVQRELSFSTNIEAIDVMIIYDESYSMKDVVGMLKREIQTGIIDVIANKFTSPGFAAYGLTGFGWRNPYKVYQHITLDAEEVKNSVTKLSADDDDELTIPAIYLSATGEEYKGQITNCVPVMAPDCEPRPLTGLPAANYNIEKETCNGRLGSVGGGCYRKESMPIFIVITDEDPMHCDPFELANQHSDCRFGFGLPVITIEDTIAAMNGIGAKFIGVNTCYHEGKPCFPSGLQKDFEFISKLTGSLDSAGNDFNFHTGTSDLSTKISEAIVSLTTYIDMNVKTGKMSNEECAGISTAEFIKGSKTVSATPEGGVSGQSETEFFSVTQGTEVVFNIDFYNDFCMNNSDGPQLYKASVTVLGNNSYLSSRLVHIIVPEQLGK